MLLYLLAVVVVAVVGGMAVALGSAIAAAFLHQLLLRPARPHARGRPGRAGAGAARLPDRGGDRQRGGRAGGAARPRRPSRPRSQAETLSALAGGELDESESLHGDPGARAQHLPDGVGGAQGAGSGRASGSVVDEVGLGAAGRGGAAALRRADRPRLRLIGRGAGAVRPGPARAAGVRRSGADRLRGPAPERAGREAGELATVDRQRTALLAAVGHDLRTPLAGDQGVRVDPAPDRRGLVPPRSAPSCWRRSRSRPTGSTRSWPTCSTPAGCRRARCRVQARPVALDEVIGAAVLAVPGRGGAGHARRARGPAARPGRSGSARARARQPARQRGAPRADRPARSR